MNVLGIAGYSGSGKTTLIEKLIPELVMVGFKVSLVKHAHHEFDIDQPGKDSWRHRHAGAQEVLVSSGRRWAIMHELRGEPEPSLQQQISLLAPCDLVIVEGYKSERIPKIEVHRAGSGKPLLYPDDPSIIAVVTDERLGTSLPQIDLDNAEAVAHFIVRYLGLRKPAIHVVK